MCAFLQSRRSGNLSRSAYIMANIMNWAHISFVGRVANLLHAYRISIRYTFTKGLVDFRNTNAAPQFLAWHEPGMLTKCSLYVGCNVVWLASKFEPRFLTIHASTKIALISTSRVSIALSIHTTARSPCLFLPFCANFIAWKYTNTFQNGKFLQTPEKISICFFAGRKKNMKSMWARNFKCYILLLPEQLFIKQNLSGFVNVISTQKI